MRLVAHDVAKHFFDVESGWLRTVRELTLAPGAMIRRYVQGHRKVYANPFAYLVLASAVSIVIQNLVGFHDRMVTIAQSNTLDSPLQMEFVNRFTELVFQYSLYISIGLLVPMIVALAEHHPDVARYLAEAGTNPHIRANDGSTLLLAAARARDVELVRWALDHGIGVNATRPKKTSATALMMAARKGSAEIVQLLLANGADPTVTNHKDQTALDAAKGKDVKELLQAVAAHQPTTVPAGTE